MSKLHLEHLDLPDALDPRDHRYGLLLRCLGVYASINGDELRHRNLVSLRALHEHLRYGNRILAGRIGQEVVTIASYYTGKQPNTEAWIHGLATRQSRRSYGYGGETLTSIIDDCTDHGAPRIKVEARHDAVDFYVRHGFQLHGEPEADTWLMVRDIA